MFTRVIFAAIHTFYYTPFNEVERGYTGPTLFRPLACLSICGQNCVRSVSSILLAGSISYLHMFSSRRFIACKAFFLIQNFKVLANSLHL